MVHRIAELMEGARGARTKAEREAAAAECEALILRVWERRSAWPKGWPPPVAAAVLDRLSSAERDPETFPFYRPKVADEGAQTWLDTFPLMVDIQQTELDIWRDAALLEVDVRELTDWVEQHGNNMAEDERNALEQLIAAAERAGERLDTRRRDPRRKEAKGHAKQDPASRLKEVQKRRAALVARIKPSASTRTKSRPTRRRTTRKRTR